MKQSIDYKMDSHGRILVVCADGIERHATQEESLLMDYVMPGMSAGSQSISHPDCR
ncbi:MAG: hypothetical protein OQJ97_02680 [Rhodospirillales bacterium]|nr:hypothetical protein [Rhodospirillales bacterium]